MRNARKHYDIERIVRNAEMLSDPQIYECFLYECEDPDGFADVEAEITELADLLPENLSILDLPNTYCGNNRTKIYGKASCSATEGHLILDRNNPNSIIFNNEDDAINAGFRPCERCMKNDYLKWKKEGSVESDKYSIHKND